MEIIKFKKMKNSKYLISLDNGIEYILYDDIIIKYNLLYNSNISVEKLKQVVEENEKYLYYDDIVKLISKRLRSKKEIIDFLEKKGLDDSNKKILLERLELEGLINDYVFSNAYINDKINLTNDGPLKIKKELLLEGIEDPLIDVLLSNIEDSLLYNKAFNIATKMVKNDNKHGKIYIINNINLKLNNLGYYTSIIESVISNLEFSPTKDLIKKEYEKLYYKYENKYDIYKLRAVIYSKLLAKGFSINEVKEVM